jgi:hypothetical protein
VLLAERGRDPRKLDAKVTGWIAELRPDGRIAPDISPV